MTQPGIEPQSPGPLVNTLTIIPMGWCSSPKISTFLQKKLFLTNIWCGNFFLLLLVFLMTLTLLNLHKQLLKYFPLLEYAVFQLCLVWWVLFFFFPFKHIPQVLSLIDDDLLGQLGAFTFWFFRNSFVYLENIFNLSYWNIAFLLNCLSESNMFSFNILTLTSAVMILLMKCNS